MSKGHGKGLYTLIGEGTVFDGNISVPHNIKVDGTFKGRIESSEVVTIGDSGVVNADIKAKSLVVGGSVVGNVIVDDKIELEANSSLTGNMKVKDLVINEGAIFHGNCSMNEDVPEDDKV